VPKYVIAGRSVHDLVPARSADDPDVGKRGAQQLDDCSISIETAGGGPREHAAKNTASTCDAAATSAPAVFHLERPTVTVLGCAA
jgi:hypothetical protein